LASLSLVNLTLLGAYRCPVEYCYKEELVEEWEEAELETCGGTFPFHKY
jgi:hypothetical protein